MSVSPRKVFVDAGSFDGDTTRIFLDKYPDASEYAIYCFEPDPMFYGQLPENVIAYNCAVSVRDGLTNFYIGKPKSSSLIGHKTSGNLSKQPMTVRCIDFSRWMRLYSNCHVVLKMNIEGSEYDVLEKMLAEGTLSCVRDLYVDWHWDRIGVPKERHDRLQADLEKLDIPVTSLTNGYFLGVRV